LLFAGRVSDSDRIRLRVLAKQYGIDGRLVLTGHVPDDDLVALFAGCELFVFPSIHEGFGLPALEAMACGAPTIGSRLTSVPEVIGRSDALFDPLDTREIMELMRSALVDKGFRESLRAHAVVQAGKFSWQVTAQRALAALERFQHRALPAITGDPDRKASYRGLLESIARIPGPSPDDRSLMGVAACIAGNGVQGERQGSVGNPC
jgi:glycosyltransferase involved in cell wall biosynthesis